MNAWEDVVFSRPMQIRGPRTAGGPRRREMPSAVIHFFDQGSNCSPPFGMGIIRCVLGVSRGNPFAKKSTAFEKTTGAGAQLTEDGFGASAIQVRTNAQGHEKHQPSENCTWRLHPM